MKKKKKSNHYRLNYSITKRIRVLQIFIVFAFALIIFQIGYLNIYKNSYYKEVLKEKTINIVIGESVPRGRIYDRNMKLLVDNVAVKSIYYKRIKGITTEEEINLAYKISKILDLEYDKLLNRNLKEFYIILYPEEVNKKITKEEFEKLENRKLKETDIYELKIDRITEEELNNLTLEDKKAAYLFYLMNKGYYYDEKEIKIENVKDKEYAYISENSNDLKGFNTKLEWERKYLYKDTLKNILGKVSSKEMGIPKEELDYYLALGYERNDRIGISGIEKQYEDILKGEKPIYKINDDNSLTLIKEGKKGKDIVLSIDIDLQIRIDKMVTEEIIKTKKDPNTEFFNKAYLVIQKPNTGEILAMSGKQLYQDKKTKKYEVFDIAEGNILATITPGSVVKGASMIVGYNTKAINIGTRVYDSCLYFLNVPRKCSWRYLGYINDIDALSWSSNVYQFRIAMKVGGFNYNPNEILEVNLDAFDIYRQTFGEFGLGVKTEIDFPKEEVGFIGGKEHADLLLNFAIGQYDTYTPLQLSQYITTIANNGSRVKPHFLKTVLREDGSTLYEIEPVILNEVTTESKYIRRVQLGFKTVMSSGLGYYYMRSAPSSAGKTGTSESYVDINGDGVVDYESMSNNFIGYAPASKPVMSIAVSTPDVQNPNRGSYKTDVNQRITAKATKIFFDLYSSKGNRKKK